MKKNSILAVLLILTLVFTGCTSTQVEFWEKNKSTSSWEAAGIDMDMTIVMSAAGINEEIKMHIEGLSNMTDMSSYMTMTMSDSTSGIAIDNIQTYVKEGKTYMNKSYFEEVAAMSGVEFPEGFFGENVEFITFTDTNALTEVMHALMKNPNFKDELMKFYEDFVKIIGVDVSVEKIDNTYRIKMNHEDIANVVKKIIVEGSANLDQINEKLKLGLSVEQITAAKAEVEMVKPEIEQLSELFSKMFKGELILDTTFDGDVVMQEIQFSFTDPVITGMSISMDATATTTKQKAKEIIIPGKVQEMTQAEYMEALVGKYVTIDKATQMMMDIKGTETACKSFVNNGEEFVECKVVLNALGKNVIYDTELQKVGIQGDTFVPLNVITQNGVSFISVDDLEALGYSVDYVEGRIIIHG